MGEVTMERDGTVAVVTVAAPDSRNALTVEMARQLVEICHIVDDDRSIGALVVRGADGTFCSGADTRGWDKRRPPSSGEAFDRSTTIYGSFVAIGHVGVPTVAAIRGFAVGAGLNLALATDLRVVARTARLRAGFLRIGLHPGGGFFALASRLGGREIAAAVGIFDQDLSGERAAACSMAWEAVDDDLVEARALELAAIAGRDPELVRRAIATFRAELGPPATSWPAALEMERGVQMWSQHRRLGLDESDRQENSTTGDDG